mgnify:CR=1 FL=1
MSIIKLFIYDPKVNSYQIESELNSKQIINESSEESGWISCNSILEAVKDADALIILTEWEEFKNLHESLEKIKELDFRDIEVNNYGVCIINYIGLRFLKRQFFPQKNILK